MRGRKDIIKEKINRDIEYYNNLLEKVESISLRDIYNNIEIIATDYYTLDYDCSDRYKYFSSIKDVKEFLKRNKEYYILQINFRDELEILNKILRDRTDYFDKKKFKFDTERIKDEINKYKKRIKDTLKFLNSINNENYKSEYGYAKLASTHSFDSLSSFSLATHYDEENYTVRVKYVVTNDLDVLFEKSTEFDYVNKDEYITKTKFEEIYREIEKIVENITKQLEKHEDKLKEIVEKNYNEMFKEEYKNNEFEVVEDKLYNLAESLVDANTIKAFKEIYRRYKQLRDEDFNEKEFKDFSRRELFDFIYYKIFLSVFKELEKEHKKKKEREEYLKRLHEKRLEILEQFAKIFDKVIRFKDYIVFKNSDKKKTIVITKDNEYARIRYDIRKKEYYHNTSVASALECERITKIDEDEIKEAKLIYMKKQELYDAFYKFKEEMKQNEKK